MGIYKLFLTGLQTKISCSGGINYTNTDSGGAELNAVRICRLGKYGVFCSFLLKYCG